MGLDLTVTHRPLTLGSQDATTGWYARDFGDEEIELFIESRSATPRQLPAGLYVRHEFGGRTPDPVWEGDEIKQGTHFYEIKTVLPAWIADSFLWRDCGLVDLPFHNRTWTVTAPTVRDPRFLTKDYLDDYLSASNLQNFDFIVCFDHPDYPFQRVVSDKGIDLIFAVTQPTTEPLISHGTGAARGYFETVPVHVLCLDVRLAWLGEAELRKVVEEHPEGSHRHLGSRRSADRWLGSTRLYDVQFDLGYGRGLT